MTLRIAPALASGIALAAVLGQAVVRGQAADAGVGFTEASIKAIDASSRVHVGRQLTPTTFVDRSNLLDLIVSAYLDADGLGACAARLASGSECAPIVGPVPAWARTDKFEIVAKLPSASLPADSVERLSAFRFSNSPRRNVYPKPLQLMLQRLLEKTFDLQVRRERMQIPVWQVTRATDELQLLYSRGSSADRHGFTVARRVRADGTPWIPPARPDDMVEVVFEVSTIKDAADFLAAYMDRPVVDRTGLEGEFDFTLEFTAPADAPSRPGAPLMAMVGFDVPRLAKALRPRGLALQSSVAVFETLIIERLQRPPD